MTENFKISNYHTQAATPNLHGMSDSTEIFVKLSIETTPEQHYFLYIFNHLPLLSQQRTTRIIFSNVLE